MRYMCGVSRPLIRTDNDLRPQAISLSVPIRFRLAAGFSPGGTPSSISNMMVSAADLAAASKVAGLFASTKSWLRLSPAGG